MKTIRQILILILFTGCSKMSTMYVNVLQPGQVTLGSNINSIVIINRSLPENKQLNVVEGILTGEGIGEDRQSEQQIVAGLNTNLMNSPRFQVKMSGREMIGSGTGNTFPFPLDWATVDQICAENNVDAVAALETYDSDCITTGGARDVQKTGKDGQKYTVKEFFADQTVYIKFGFRIYNKHTRNIEDQFTDTYVQTWHTKGNSIQDAANSMINKRMAVSQSCYQAGQNFGRRISPNWTSVGRRYYKKGNADLEKAGRMAAVGNWKEAADIWLAATHCADSKVCGRATYNLALASETQGNLGTAREWAMKAYAEYNVKNARSYAAILDQRIWEQQRLDQQMKSAE